MVFLNNWVLVLKGDDGWNPAEGVLKEIVNFK